MNSLMIPTFFTVGLQPVDYAIVAGYMLGLLGMGWSLPRKQVNIEDFSVISIAQSTQEPLQ